MLTIFSAPKPFSDPHIARIQRNAIASWLQLDEEVEVLLVGDEPGMMEAGAEFGVKVLREVERNEEGTPLISSVFQLASSEAQYPFLCYVNADILLLEDLIDALHNISSRLNDFLILGQRWDLDLERELTFDEGWQRNLMAEVQTRGRRHPPMGSDYFIFRRGFYQDVPAFALGRAGWDNWMIFAGRRAGLPVVDASEAIMVIHQNHEYRHLPNSQPHYRLPESEENIRLAGGMEMIFTLKDANFELADGCLKRRGILTAGLLRWIETSLFVLFGPGKLSRSVHILMHPVSSGKYFFSQLSRRTKKKVR